MKMLKMAILICICGILGLSALAPHAKADAWNQKTELSFNQPVEIPGQVLPAGTYWFVLSGGSDRNVVQVFNQNCSQLDATVFTVSTNRQWPTATTQLEFAERPHHRPEALLKWFYPGRLTGHEFEYSARNEGAFARDPEQIVPQR